MVELVKCVSDKNDKLLIGSSSFDDVENGRFTDLQDYYKNKDSIYAKLNVEEGYYYLGVKSNIELN
jgi:hypothetical protein